LENRYIEALQKELRGFQWPWTPETLYLGGGTPSLLPGPALRSLTAAISGRPWKEATIEAAPGNITAEIAREWREAGITRVSLGVQSFIARELTRTGRKHTAETVLREVAILREADIGNFSIDLIAGLPGQTASSWGESLDWIGRLDAPHVSVYMLEVDEDSRLGAEIIAFGKRYGAVDVPSEDQIADFYETAVDRLGNLGIYRYEISNFARAGFESAHNLKYWRREPYLGFGADAHSFDGSARAQNVASPAEYVDRISRGEPPVAGRTPADPDSERLFLGLRLCEGIAEDLGRFNQPIERCLNEGLLERQDGRLRLTPRGMLLSNEVFAEFV
jgi:oxygen-independent coproporphyrinogen-3 oxidase